MKKFKWTIIAILLTPILLFLVIFLAGGGHGNYLPAIVLFPFGMLTLIFEEEIIVYIFTILGILQFPVYGYLMDRFIKRKNILLFPILLHIIVVIFILVTNQIP